MDVIMEQKPKVFLIFTLSQNITGKKHNCNGCDY